MATIITNTFQLKKIYGVLIQIKIKIIHKRWYAF